MAYEGGEKDGEIQSVRESGKTNGGSAAQIVVAGEPESTQIKRRGGDGPQMPAFEEVGRGILYMRVRDSKRQGLYAQGDLEGGKRKSKRGGGPACDRPTRRR